MLQDRFRRPEANYSSDLLPFPENPPVSKVKITPRF